MEEKGEIWFNVWTEQKGQCNCYNTKQYVLSVKNGNVNI